MTTPVNQLELGAEYECINSRKGRFFMQVTKVNPPWIEGVITKGKAGAMCDYNELFEGDSVTVRDAHSTFIRSAVTE